MVKGVECTLMNDKQFIEDNVKLVYYLIQKYYPTYAYDEDIIQCGMIGLCKAAKAWQQKGKFSSYAKKCIFNEIKNELKYRQKHSAVISLEVLLEGDKSNDY